MTKEDFEQWKDSSVTKEVMARIHESRERFREAVIHSAASGETVLSAKLAGNIEGFDYLLNIEWEGNDD